MAENSNDEKDLQEEKKIDSNLREIISRASKNRDLTKDEIKKLENEAKQSLNFLEKINEIEIPKDKYVVFIDGTQQLVSFRIWKFSPDVKLVSPSRGSISLQEFPIE